MTLPPNPQRPLTATTCAEAQARHAEALAGSSLISAHENAEMVAITLADMQRLCPQDPGAPKKT